MIYEDGIKVIVADASHEKYVDLILDTIREAAKKRGTGIAERTHEYVATKMKEGKAVLALDPSKQTELGDTFVGFSYIETWGNKSYVTTSGLIVHPDYQGRNIAKRIKDHTFTLARVRWPHAKIFSLTSGDAVMKMNTALGYVPVSFNQLTDDDAFWRGCRGCINHPILEMKNRKFCICTGMLYDPAQHHGEPTPVEIFQEIMREMVKRESPLPTSPKGEELSASPSLPTSPKGEEFSASPSLPTSPKGEESPASPPLPTSPSLPNTQKGEE